MKQLVVLFIACAAMLSCKKNPDFENVNSSLKFDNPALTQVMAEVDYDKQKLMYKSLTAKEKYEIWDKKLASLIAAGKMNETQKTFIQNTKNLLSESFFESGNGNQINESEIKAKAIELFGKEDAYLIFASLGNPYSKMAANMAYNCGCSQVSDWCWNQCGDAVCDGTMSGCGTFWNYPCNGDCR